MNQLDCIVNTYKKYFGENAETIVEIGSRDGHDSFYLSKKMNSSRVYTFEANPYCYTVITTNYPEFNNIYGAVSNFSGQSEFNVVQSNDWNAVGTSSLRDRNDSWYEGKSSKIIVDVSTMKDYILSYKLPSELDIVKIDVEGCSFEVLEGFDYLLSTVKVFHIENETYAYWSGQKLADEVAELLESKGFFKDYQENFGENSIDEVWVNGNIV